MLTKCGVLLTLVAGVLFSCSVSGAQDSNEWFTVNKDYSSQRYVDLDQINAGNVQNLKEVCEAQLNEPSWFSSGVLMVNRTLYVSTFRGTYAVDAATCEIRWRSVIKMGQPANISSRGPAYLDGKIFRGTSDGRVIALDAKTGAVLWDTQLADPKANESFVAAPIAWQDKVYIGIAISDLGIRGRLIAVDANTGKELWRFFTVPEDGGKSWGNGKPAGGGFWTTFSLDPVTGEVFGSSANPAPDYDGDIRPGDNFYTDSAIAINANTGKLSWYFQHTPHDDHDWDLGSTPTLYRSANGKSMMVVAGKDGWVAGVDRDTKKQVFKSPATTVSTLGPLQPKLTLTCPGLGGGSQFNGAAYSPVTGALYIGEVDWCTYFGRPQKEQPEGGAAHADTGTQSVLNYGYEGAIYIDFTHQPKGQITAMDGDTGRLLWKFQTDSQMLAGLVPTKAGLVFAGDVRGNLFAFDAKNGTVLKHIDVGGALNNGIISYAVEGTQYVAAAVGGVTLNPRGIAGPLKIEVLGIKGSDEPKVATFDRVPPQLTGPAAAAEVFNRVCAACHGNVGQGRTYPALTRLSELGDPATLKRFLANVPPPMPVLYPGLLTEDEVDMIAAYMKDKVVDAKGPTAGYVQPKSGGTPQWQVIYSVMTNPRCSNCHTSTDYPRQTDDRYPHVYAVVRGPDDKGEEMKRCEECHGIRNDPITGIPGRPDWHAAPLSMSTESAPGVPKSGPQLCADLKDKSKNGNRDLAQIEEFLRTDDFVLWPWDPGVRPNGQPRTWPAPATHDVFMQNVKEWIDQGAPCPTE